MSANYQQLTEFTRELADIVARRLAQSVPGMDATQAGEVGLLAAQDFCDEFSGQGVYVPQAFAVAITERDEDMYRAYLASGRNVHEVARQFNLGIQAVYKRVRLLESAAFRRSQGQLFGE